MSVTVKLTAIQRRMHEAKALAHAVANGEVENKGLSDDEKKIISMGYAYEEMLGRYLHRPAFKYFRKIVTKGSYTRANICFLKAVLLADRHSVEYPIYIRSQFYWFDLWFHRAPKIAELAGSSGTFPAEKRLVEYLALVKSGKIHHNISSVVLPTKTIVTDLVLDKINQARVKQLCTAYQLTEAEALAQFAPVGLFDLAWLRRQPGYQLQWEEGPP